MKSEELRAIMGNYSGTEQYHRMPLINLLVTDGVIGFIKNAGANWFVTDVGLFRKQAQRKNPEETMFSVHLISKNDKANIVFKDGNGKVCLMKNYSYTDCPEGDWVFYYYPLENLLIWNGEY